MADEITAQDFPGTIAAVVFEAAIDVHVDFLGYEDDMVVLVKNDHGGVARTITFEPVGTIGPVERGGEIEIAALAVECAPIGVVTAMRPSKVAYATAASLLHGDISAPAATSYALVRIYDNASIWFHATGLYDKHIYDQT